MINYPIKKKTNLTQSNTSVNNKVTYTRRGMSLETLINDSNDYYLSHNKAIIYKKPTPVQVVHVSYPSRDKAMIDEAYYKVPSTTDYNGIYRGRYIDFEAKTTNSKTAFTLNNVSEHQVEHLKRIIEHGGIGFIIVSFSVYDEYYYVDFSFFYEYWMNQNTSRKSIPYQIIKEECTLIDYSYTPRLDYLKIIDEIYF